MSCSNSRSHSWRRKWQPTPVPLPGKSPGQRSLVGYSPWGCKESDTTEWLHVTSQVLLDFLLLPGVTGKFGLGVQNEAGQKLVEFCQENTLVIANTAPVIANTIFQQHKTLHMDITRWSTPKSDWLYSLHQRWRSSIQSEKTRLGADCGSDHELLIAKFRLKLK